MEVVASIVTAFLSSLRVKCTNRQGRIVVDCVNSFETKVSMKMKNYLSKVYIVKARKIL